MVPTKFWFIWPSGFIVIIFDRHAHYLGTMIGLKKVVFYFSLYPPSGIIFNSIHNYLEIMLPIDVLRFSEFRTMRNHLSETLMLNDIQITSDYMSRWVVLKRRVGAVTSQRVLKVLFYVNILQCFFVVENFTANAVSVAIGDNGNRLN